MSGDRIRIAELSFDCIIGVLPRERNVAQTVVMDLELHLDLAPAGRSGRISETVDYGQVSREVEALVRFRRYKLVEAAAEETAAMLLGVHPLLHEVQIRVCKPAAIERAQGAEVVITRDREAYPHELEQTEWGHAEILLETREAGLYLLHVDAGRDIPRHRHEVMRELEWLVAGELWREGEPVEPSVPVTWGRGEVHSYQNRGADRSILFCCDCPPFIPQDEIPVRRRAGGLR